MILATAITQFVFVSLGILALNVLLRAGGYSESVASSFPPFAVALAQHTFWIFAVPLAWAGFATLCERSGKWPFNESTARVSGILVAAAIFILYVYASSTLF